MTDLDHVVREGDSEWIAVSLSPTQAREILLRNTSPNLLVMCRGYNDEDDQFTELVCEEDQDLDFDDLVSYPEFQLWFRFDAERSNEGDKL